MSLNTLPFNPFPPSSDQKGSGGSSYVLPAATDETLGGIKVGDNLTVEEDGTLNAEDPYSPLDYSTEEQNTGVKWIDGKDIWFKTVDTGALPNNTSKTVSMGVLNANIVDFRGIASSAANDYNIVMPSSTTNNRNSQMNINGATGIITIATADDYSVYTKSYITVYYTKTETEE